MKFANLTVKAKFTILVCAVIAAFGLFGAITQSTMDRIKVTGPLYADIVTGKDIVADILPPPEYIIESYLTAMQLTNDGNGPEREALEAKLAQLRKDYEARQIYWQENLVEGPMHELLLSTSSEPARRFYTVADERLIPLLRNGKNEEAAALMGGELRNLYEQHRAAIDELVVHATKFSADAEARAASQLKSGRTWLVGTAGISVVLLVGFCVLIAWSICRPLIQLEERLKDIAQGEGDLTKRVDIHSKDEVGRVAGWLNVFLDNIHSVISQVSGTTTQVAAAATEIAASAEEMSSAVGEVARQSTSAAQRSDASGRHAGQGGVIVQTTIERMNEIEIAVSESAASVRALGERGDEIGRVISVINDIADQTNLLALNAAIEAARAGEHGRGFAVVADEVRKLADRTTKATEEIAGSIKAIQSETTTAVERMSQGSAQVKAGVDAAAKAGESLEEIVAGTADLAGMITSISAASEEAGAGASQSASAAADLSSKAEQLRALVERFKV